MSEKLLFRGGTAIHATGLEAGKTERQWPSGSRLLASVSDGEPLDPPTLLVSPLPTPTPTGRLGETAGHAGAVRKRPSEVGCAGLCPRFGRPPDLRPLKPPGPGSGPGSTAGKDPPANTWVGGARSGGAGAAVLGHLGCQFLPDSAPLQAFAEERFIKGSLSRAAFNEPDDGIPPGRHWPYREAGIPAFIWDRDQVL